MPLIPFRTYKPYIYAGDLRYAMSLRKPVSTRTSTGASETTWVEVEPEVWCQKVPLRGSQTFYAQSFAPGVTSILRCRYRVDIDAGYQLADNLYTYTIMHPPIDLDGLNAVLLMYVRELRMTGPVNT